MQSVFSFSDAANHVVSGRDVDSRGGELKTGCAKPRGKFGRTKCHYVSLNKVNQPLLCGSGLGHRDSLRNQMLPMAEKYRQARETRIAVPESREIEHRNAAD